MKLFADLAYGTNLGPFPMIAWVGFFTYAVILAAALLAAGRKWSKHLRRVPPRVHRILGILALILATLHLLMGVSAYV
ncbi:hypothetical protein IH601_09095 [Candidatus Bipolaricaulota bacterium]|jgi:DMSO/TMAO reductase YedYZ heme-binding membrane subunit|nr:hypothetical protein [Candidatus Bipolaricaulota bacterium]TFH10761.1 MAG: hypothetical protein E4H08_02920 [Candidatus Atribacteria bacterium]